MGMSKREGASFISRAIRKAMGMNTATTAVLRIKALNKAVLSISQKISLRSLLLARWIRRSPASAGKLVRCNPALRMNMVAMVTVAGLENPASPSCGVTMPNTIKVTITPSATKSTRTRSVANATSAMTKITRTVNPSIIHSLSGNVAWMLKGDREIIPQS